ncbi:MAG: hypothetical protein PHI28_08295 [Mangrovibacterium sp.]|nr:hypothetical protein [Mangrovibacterium sp.]
MFGIDQISWDSFLGFIISILLLWYPAVLLWAWFRGKSRNRRLLFEEDYSTTVFTESTGPVSVSSQDYPAGLVPLRLSEDIPLPVSLYEETRIDDGYPIECFTEPGHPELPKILEQVQFQQ